MTFAINGSTFSYGTRDRFGHQVRAYAAVIFFVDRQADAGAQRPARAGRGHRGHAGAVGRGRPPHRDPRPPERPPLALPSPRDDGDARDPGDVGGRRRARRRRRARASPVIGPRRPANRVGVALAGAAVGVLAWALATGDFTLAYVAATTDRATSWPYRLAGLWGGMGGSLLLWSALVAAWGWRRSIAGVERAALAWLAAAFLLVDLRVRVAVAPPRRARTRRRWGRRRSCATRRCCTTRRSSTSGSRRLPCRGPRRSPRASPAGSTTTGPARPAPAPRLPRRAHRRHGRRRPLGLRRARLGRLLGLGPGGEHGPAAVARGRRRAARPHGAAPARARGCRRARCSRPWRSRWRCWARCSPGPARRRRSTRSARTARSAGPWSRSPSPCWRRPQSLFSFSGARVAESATVAPENAALPARARRGRWRSSPGLPVSPSSSSSSGTLRPLVGADDVAVDGGYYATHPGPRRCGRRRPDAPVPPGPPRPHRRARARHRHRRINPGRVGGRDARARRVDRRTRLGARERRRGGGGRRHGDGHAVAPPRWRARRHAATSPRGVSRAGCSSWPRPACGRRR